MKKSHNFNLIKRMLNFSKKLQSKVILIYLCITLLVLILITSTLPASLYKQNLNIISKDFINQMKHIDFALSNFIKEVKNDIIL